MRQLIIHQVNVTHYRLIELSLLAEQARPFYDWIERHARQITGSHRSLSEILLLCSSEEMLALITACYSDKTDDKPLLFDGIGRVYPHRKACFYFFAWMIRDAPQQRLAPLISQMQKLDSTTKLTAEIDTLAGLIHEYRSVVKGFDWPAIREVVLDRLEGSRRSIGGHAIEAYVRTSLVTALQFYYLVHGNYGQFKRVEIADRQVKFGAHTIDVSANLIPKVGDRQTRLLMPVKTRETEGGGHSHLFTRDIITAISGLDVGVDNFHIIGVIIAENWSASELKVIGSHLDMVFHFNMSPNQFTGFDEEAQIRLNRFVSTILGGEDDE